MPAMSDSVAAKVPPVKPEGGLGDVVEDDDNWDLENIFLSNNADVCSSLPMDFAAIHPLLSGVFKFPVKLFGIQGLGALQAVDWTKV